METRPAAADKGVTVRIIGLLLALAVMVGCGSAIGGTTPAAGTTLNKIIGTTSSTIIFASDIAGSDCGVKINTADSNLGVNPGEIWVDQSCGTSHWTPVTLCAAGNNHIIRFVQGGTYVGAGTLITIAANSTACAVHGTGRNGTILSSSSTSAPVIVLAAGTTNSEVTDLTVKHSVTVAAGSGAHGIDASQNQSENYIGRIFACGNDNGINLGSTDYSLLDNTNSFDNYGNGVDITNDGTHTAVQWSLNHILAANNNGNGYYIHSNGTNAGIIPGKYSDINSFANTGYGFYALGTSHSPIYALRINGAFLGEDGNDEIALATYGSSHRFVDMYLEYAGQTVTGIDNATAASGIGNGLRADSSNYDFSCTSCTATVNSYNGFQSGATHTTLVGTMALTNGAALSASNRNGIVINAGSATITGGQSSNTGASYQLYGIANNGATYVAIYGMDLSGNATAPFFGSCFVTP
jgi:hypothetical protein